MDGVIGKIERGIDYCSEDFILKRLNSIKVETRSRPVKSVR